MTRRRSSPARPGYLPRVFGGRPLGIWLAITLAFVLQGSLMAIRFMRGPWKNLRL